MVQQCGIPLSNAVNKLHSASACLVHLAMFCCLQMVVFPALHCLVSAQHDGSQLSKELSMARERCGCQKMLEDADRPALFLGQYRALSAALSWFILVVLPEIVMACIALYGIVVICCIVTITYGFHWKFFSSTCYDTSDRILISIHWHRHLQNTSKGSEQRKAVV